MKNIMVFCIPAHGHHNPTFPVVAELVKRGNKVRYYSFEEFREKIEKTGAEYISCDRFLPELSNEEEQALKSVSTTEMTIVDLRTTGKMDGFLKEQVEEFKPDVIVTDSVCFWGKLTARKYKIPMVVSTTTFAFNKYSSGYMKSSFAEIMDLMKGSGRVKAELKALEKYGYHEKSIMPLVQNDNYTDTVVYATKKYQPCSETFSKHYAFVGPSLYVDKQKKPADKTVSGGRPLVYISLGTVLNEKPDFYNKCIDVLKEEKVDVIISCGKSIYESAYKSESPENGKGSAGKGLAGKESAGKDLRMLPSLEELPENIKIYPYVNQLEILAKADVFLTHCGMNSASEGLYMGTPMVLFPQTNEQRAVERRVLEMGAGVSLKGDSREEIKEALFTILNDKKYADAAAECSRDFWEAPGPEGAADFIEAAPHLMPEEDKKMMRREIYPGLLQLLFWIVGITLIIVLPKYVNIAWWVIAIIANVIFIPYKQITMKI